MVQGLVGRLATAGILGAAFVSAAALDRMDLLAGAPAAVSATAALSALAWATFPRERPAGFAWLPVAFAAMAAVGTLAAVVTIALDHHRAAPWIDHSGMTLLGLGMVGACLIKRILLLIDESRTWEALAKAGRAPAP